MNPRGRGKEETSPAPDEVKKRRWSFMKLSETITRIKVCDATDRTWFANLERVQEWVEEEICEGARVLKAKWYVFKYPITGSEETHAVVWLEIKDVLTAFKRDGCLIIDKDGSVTFRIADGSHYWWFIINNPNYEFVRER